MKETNRADIARLALTAKYAADADLRRESATVIMQAVATRANRAAETADPDDIVEWEFLTDMAMIAMSDGDNADAISTVLHADARLERWAEMIDRCFAPNALEGSAWAARAFVGYIGALAVYAGDETAQTDHPVPADVLYAVAPEDRIPAWGAALGEMYRPMTVLRSARFVATIAMDEPRIEVGVVDHLEDGHVTHAVAMAEEHGVLALTVNASMPRALREDAIEWFGSRLTHRGRTALRSVIG